MPNSFKKEADRLFSIQADNQETIRGLTIAERKDLLKKLLAEVHNHRTAIQSALHNDLGKSPVETDYAEIFPIISEIKHFIRNLNRWAKRKPVRNNPIFWGSKTYILYEPRGKCLIISPWNYPFQLPLLHLIACISAGNTAIIKPSEFAPHTSAVLKTIIAKVFHENHVAIFEGGIDETTYLLTKQFDHIHFTGSPGVGRVVMGAAAKNLSSVTLELGGKSPAIVDETANIDDTVKKLLWGKLVNLGQTCIAPDYILIHEKVEQRFIDAFISRCEMAFGKTSWQSPHLARMINTHHFNRVKKLVEDAMSRGAEIAFGGEYRDEQLFISPTLLRKVPKDAAIMEEEIFGPVFPILTFSNYDEAKAIINAKQKPLSMYIFSTNNNALKYFQSITSSGAIVMNEVLVHIQHPHIPFGGVNNSGIGQSTGFFGFREFSHEKPVLKMRLSITPSKILNFPYTPKTQRAINFFIKWL